VNFRIMISNTTKFPSTVHFYPTMRCPLNCSYCYVEEVNKDRKELSIDTYYRLIEEGSKLGVENYDIAGGEPFVWPHFISLLQAIKRCGAKSKVVTSGILLDRHSDVFAQEMNLISELHVSIDSADAQIHDETRGYKGLHRKVTANIGHYVKERYGPVKVNYVLQKGTFLRFREMLDFTVSLGVQGIDIQCLVDVSSKTKGNNFALEPRELLEAYDMIMHWLETDCPDEFQVLFVVPGYMLPYIAQHGSAAKKKRNFQLIFFPGMRGGSAFRDAIFIKHNGEVTGSTTFINNERWFIGNVMTDSMEQIWETGAERMLHRIGERSKALMHNGVCADCSVKRFCQGGDPEVFQAIDKSHYCSLKESLQQLNS